MEIFSLQSRRFVDIILQKQRRFQLVELGPGDAVKSIHLLKALVEAGADFEYVPIDISANVIDNLEISLPTALPALRVSGMNGEYFQMLDRLKTSSQMPKVVLCLGANIGNMTIEASHSFCSDTRDNLVPGDLAIIGFDLVKNPNIVRAAYDDKAGFTRKFNLNLLARMNRQLNADFDIDSFDHYCNYDPETGSCKSYLVSTVCQDVHFPGQTIRFEKNECIWMEISQKFTAHQINEMALSSGFRPVMSLTDTKDWFMDVVWMAV
jgi:uncharacterized SAM-dependent methyltransferase